MRAPTEQATYREGVIDKLKNIEEQVSRLDKKVDENHVTLSRGQEAIDAKVTFTNGKVKKLIIALVLLGGIVIGQLGTGGGVIAKLITSFL